MTYAEFHVEEMKILADCRELIKSYRYEEFNDKMKLLIDLQDKYLQSVTRGEK